MPEASLEDWTSAIVQIMAAVFLVVIPIILLYHRIKNNRPIATVRMIQVLALVMILPTILIFGLSKRLESSTIGTLLAALAGMFSGLANYAGSTRRGSTNPSGGVKSAGDDQDDDADP